MDIYPLPAFDDNYVWLLHDSGQAVVIDPGEAEPVLAALDHLSLALTGILVTHHHGDHVAGIAELLQRHPAEVWGPASPAIAGLSRPLHGGERIRLLGLEIDVLHVPGHTASHLAYHLQPPGQAPLLFCGDTLFSGGCGRLFDGTAAQMHASLTRLAALPADTRVCCAHEYTLANLRFAQAVEPDNPDLAAYQSECAARRAAGQPTLPAQLGRERLINPFLRCDVDSVVDAARRRDPGAADAVSVFTAIRQWKNEYR